MSDYTRRFEGRNALVTGGASGIGRACVLRLAQEGAWVAVIDQNLDGAQETVRAVEAQGGRAMAIACDVSDSASVDAAMAEVGANCEGLDVAVNCAGVGGSGLPLEELTDEGWQRTVGINLTGVFYSMRAEHPLLKRNGGGAIVNISSIFGKVGFADEGAYVAAKHGVIGLTRSAALSWGEDNIRVTAVCPTIVKTPLTERRTAEGWNQMLAMHPLSNLPETEDVAALVAFLGSDDARTLTGSEHLVDAGYTAS